MAADPYTTPQNPVSAPLVARVNPGAAFSRAVPGIATTAVLGLGRYWHAHGAAHSIGDAILAGGLTLGCTIAAAAIDGAESATTRATALGLAGGCAAAGIVGYSGEMALPLLVWALATTAAYALARRTWRTERHGEIDHARRMEADRARYDHELQVEAIRAHSAELAAQYSVTAAAYQARALAAVVGPQTAIPAIDPAAFALSPAARAALDPATVRLIEPDVTDQQPVTEPAS